MSSADQGEGFIEVTRGSKKRKASNSPSLSSQPKSGSPKPPLGTPVCANHDSSDNQWCRQKIQKLEKLMGELPLTNYQYHPARKVSRIKEPQKGDSVAIGVSMQDVIMLQNESKMKAALGKNIKISLPKAFQTSKDKQKVLLWKE